MTTTTETAREAVPNIAKRYGWYARGSAVQRGVESQSVIQDSLLAKNSLAVYSIQTLVKNSYDTEIHFLFELLKNADKNKFTRATKAGEDPFVSFEVHPDRIVVECNEDGLTVGDIVALCAMGATTETPADGYIRAHIGLKSVFAVARKVHVQTGNFSFSFEHKKGSPGLGTVLPIYEDAGQEITGCLTRMTLFLHKNGDTEHLTRLQDAISRQVADLQHTCLLFLKNIKEIRVTLYDETGYLEDSKIHRLESIHGHIVTLETVSIEPLGAKMVSRHYHVTRHLATDLARSSDRGILDTKKGGPLVVSTTAEVVLAFPLTDDSEPVVEPQQIFNFFPVKEYGFKFIIHSDFDTSAGEQDILPGSRRNIDLLDSIADAFIEAVLQLCNHETLRFTWPYYLPCQDQVTSKFWAGLAVRVTSRLMNASVLFSRYSPIVRKFGEVRVISPFATNMDGDCVFDDHATDPFASKKYTRRALGILQEYGLKGITVQFMLDLITSDLASVKPRMQSKEISADCHTWLAVWLSHMFSIRSEVEISRLRALAILPLMDGTWVSADSGAVYLPTTKGIPVPERVEMRLLDPAAVENYNRQILFGHLGATESTIPQVRVALINGYPHKRDYISAATSQRHLRYLYLTHASREASNPSMERLYVVTGDGTTVYHRKTAIYLPSSDPYGLESLLTASDGQSVLGVRFLDRCYLEDPPTPVGPTGISWERWLCDFVGIREQLCLVSQSTDSMSDAFKHAMKSQPEKLLYLLRHSWQRQGYLIMKSTKLKAEISNTPADSLCGKRGILDTWTLQDTYLPYPNLREQVARLMDDSEGFPFLDIEGFGSGGNDSQKWAFLRIAFGVKGDDTAEFLVDVLRSVKQHWITHLRLKRVGRTRLLKLRDLYLAIAAKVLESEPAEEKRVLQLFCTHTLVFNPNVSSCGGDWGPPQMYLWDPDLLDGVNPMRYHFEVTLNTPPEQMVLLNWLSRRILSVKNMSLEAIVEYLEYLDAEQPGALETSLWLYQYLDDMSGEGFESDLRRQFENRSLIRATRDSGHSWCRTSECQWSSATEIRGQATLSGMYGDLKGFFVDKLGVKEDPFQTIYDELAQTTTQTSVEVVKTRIWSLNEILRSGKGIPSSKSLPSAPIYPIKSADGVVRLCHADTDFAIVDREKLAAPLRGKITVLDYTAEEVFQLKPFVEWAGLQDRYLSASIKETTFLSVTAQSRSFSGSMDISLKAHAFLRIAATFESVRYRADAAGFIKSFATPSGDLHLGETNAGIKVYVPMDKESQAFTFASLLPVRLAEWLILGPEMRGSVRVDPEAVSTVAAILSCEVAIAGLVEFLLCGNDGPPPEDQRQGHVRCNEFQHQHCNARKFYL